MQSKKHLNKCHYLHMGPIPLEVGFCITNKAFKAALAKLDESHVYEDLDVDARVHIFKHREKGNHVFIRLNEEYTERYSEAAVIALCAHEATHVMQECKCVMGATDGGDEWEAYTVQHVLQFMLEKLGTE